MGFSSSKLNKPPAAVRPTLRLKQHDKMVLIELSDLRDEHVVATNSTPTYLGRQRPSNMLIPTSQRAKVASELKRNKIEKNKELQLKQEAQLKENARQDKLLYALQKQNEIKFKMQQERIQEFERKRNPTLEQTVDTNANAIVKEDVDVEVNEKTSRVSQFNLAGVTKGGWGHEVDISQYADDSPELRPPTYRKKDIVPNIKEFNLFDMHAIKAPQSARASISSLVNYLKDKAENHLQLARMFYRWITVNVNFDVEAYYAEDVTSSVRAEDVLKTSHTVAEGYANLMVAMCRYAGIPAEIIRGIVKGYEYQVGDVVNFTDSHVRHAWNAIYINRNWFFVDCAWGAGYVDQKRNWHRKFQEFYFIVDPDKMIIDHFPFMDEDLKSSSRWQLLATPVSANSFSQRLKLERAALEWDVKPVTHAQQHIITVCKEVEVRLQEEADELEDYSVHFVRRDGSRNLERSVFACKLSKGILKIVIRPPEEIDYLLKIYAKKSLDFGGNSELLVTYILKVVEVHHRLRKFPPNSRIYGAVLNYKKYGFSSDLTASCEFLCKTGEMILPLKTSRDVKCMTQLEHAEEKKDLTSYCLITASDVGISIKMRFPFEGYYKMRLFGKQVDDDNFRPVVTFLVDCTQISHVLSGYPVAFEAALDLKCSLYKPLWKELPANSSITIVMFGPKLTKAKVLFHELTGDENHMFEGKIVTPPAGHPFTIYGQTTDDSPMVGLYHFSIF